MGLGIKTFLRRTLRRDVTPTAAENAGAYWDAQSARESVYWTAHGPVRQYVNELITGVSWLFPTVALKAGWAFRPWPNCVSIGCGTGALERNVRLLNICERVTGYDVSRESVRAARAAARAERITGIKYKVADCNSLRFKPESLDGAFFHGSLHHIDNVEGLLDQLLRALKPGGFIYLDDYVGPSRDEWTDDHLRHAREYFEQVPDELKLWPVNPPLDYQDPSEMIRSSRILPELFARFNTLHYKPYWGNLLFPLLCAVDGAPLMRGEHRELLLGAIEQEKELCAAGAFESPLFAVALLQKA